jgi:hypothetical protein
MVDIVLETPASNQHTVCCALIKDSNEFRYLRRFLRKQFSVIAELWRGNQLFMRIDREIFPPELSGVQAEAKAAFIEISTNPKSPSICRRLPHICEACGKIIGIGDQYTSRYAKRSFQYKHWPSCPVEVS